MHLHWFFVDFQVYTGQTCRKFKTGYKFTKKSKFGCFVTDVACEQKATSDRGLTRDRRFGTNSVA